LAKDEENFGQGLQHENRDFAHMKRILIVDDEAFLLQGLGRALQNMGTDVRIVETGAAALSEIASSAYQLCFLDLFLPDLNGTKVLERIKEISPQTKVVIMTAGVVNNEMKDSIENSAYMFITKPFELLQVKMIVKRVMGEAA
jgi:DNA-binding NtrC family response regulator